MSSAERERVIADETAIERKYSDALAQKAKDARSLMRENINNSWTTSITSDAPQSGELIGRVGLGEPNVTLDGSKDFYIGTAKYEGDDLQVFSWTAPIAACTYYRQPADRAHLEELNNAVVGVRVFAHQYDQIADYQDEAVGEADPGHRECAQGRLKSARRMHPKQLSDRVPTWAQFLRLVTHRRTRVWRRKKFLARSFALPSCSAGS